MLFKLSLLTVLIIPVVFGINSKELIDFAVKQYSKVVQTVRTGVQYPSFADPLLTSWETTGGFNNQWTAGWYPGVLWYLYKYTKNIEWKNLAIKATDGMFENQFRTDTHDIGFMIMCSYNNGYEFTNNSSYPKIIANAANNLAKRYSRKSFIE
jgi:hypothetical protein